MQSLEDRAEGTWYREIPISFICVRSIILTKLSVLFLQRCLSGLLYIRPKLTAQSV